MPTPVEVTPPVSLLQQAFLIPQKPVAPPPPKPAPLAPSAPTLANLLSGAVARPDFGSLLKTPPGQEGPTPANGQDTGPQTGTILWYNGRRKCGLLLADRDQRQLRILPEYRELSLDFVQDCKEVHVCMAHSSHACVRLKVFVPGACLKAWLVIPFDITPLDGDRLIQGPRKRETLSCGTCAESDPRHQRPGGEYWESGASCASRLDAWDSRKLLVTK